MIIQPIKPSWGHALVSDNTVRFSHELLAHISDKILGQYLLGVSYIERTTDTSIILHIENDEKKDEVFTTLLTLCSDKYAFFETPKSYYKIPPYLHGSLLSWALAFEGCLAMLLLSDTTISHYFKGDFEYVNAKTGGLYLAPFTLFLQESYPRIVHPVTLNNIEDRFHIEQKAAQYIRFMLRRMEQAQKGMEGIALLSLVEEKTGISSKQITNLINAKSSNVQAPIYCGFFSVCNAN